MKIQFVGDGSPLYQVFVYPGGKLVKGQTVEAKVAPSWLANAHPGTFLVDGKPNEKRKISVPITKSESEPDSEKEESNG